MASVLSFLNAANEVAYLSGLFNWQMNNASYTTPDGQTTISFHVINNAQIPATQYVAGAINSFNLISSLVSKDTNVSLFNTQLSATKINETISRKYTINRIPYANYDQLVDLGVGVQRITFNVLFVGTMYQTAYNSFIQALFNNNGTELGSLEHPFYGTIENVLPIEVANSYSYDSLNCVMCDVTFVTSDITHISPSSVKSSIVNTIGTYYVGIQNSITSLNALTTTLKTFNNQLVAQL